MPRAKQSMDGNTAAAHVAYAFTGVDGSHIGECISYMRRSGIAVHRLFCSGHFSSSVFIRVYCISARVSCRSGPRLSVWRPVVCSGHTDR